jgi:Ca2+-transporting ATPase
MLCYFYPWQVALGVDKAKYGRAVAFSLLALSPLFHAFSCRSQSASILALRPLVSVPLVLAVLLSAAIHLVSVLVPSLRGLFSTYEMSGTEWLILIVLSAAIVPVIEILKWMQRANVIGRDMGPMSRRYPG